MYQQEIRIPLEEKSQSAQRVLLLLLLAMGALLMGYFAVASTSLLSRTFYATGSLINISSILYFLNRKRIQVKPAIFILVANAIIWFVAERWLAGLLLFGAGAALWFQSSKSFITVNSNGIDLPGNDDPINWEEVDTVIARGKLLTINTRGGNTFQFKTEEDLDNSEVLNAINSFRAV